MNLTDLLSALSPRQFLAIAIGLSIVAYAFAANAAWTVAHDARPNHRGGRGLERLKRSWFFGGFKQVARWLYYLGLPYATLMLGYDTVRAMGVWNLDWLGGIPSAGMLLLGSVVLILWIWRPYATSQHPHAIDESRWNWARHVVEALYQQAHWAFYRSGPILWLGDFYWGSFLGLGLAFVEGWTNPNVRGGVREVTRADAPLWTGSLAVVSTIIFVYTQNLWYCVFVHLLLDLGLRTTIGFPRVSAFAEAGFAAYVPDSSLGGSSASYDDASTYSGASSYDDASSGDELTNESNDSSQDEEPGVQKESELTFEADEPSVGDPPRA